MSEKYNVKILEAHKEMSVPETIKSKDISNMTGLDEVVEADAIIIIKPLNYVELLVHNDYSDDKEYNKYVIQTEDEYYVTGSQSFNNAMLQIISDYEDAGLNFFEEGVGIKVYKLPSKNYSGKKFLTCSLA